MWQYCTRFPFMLGILLVFVVVVVNAQIDPIRNVEKISDYKQFKKILRVRTNILVLIANGAQKSDASLQKLLSTFSTAATQCTGIGTLLLIDCFDATAKKLCKKLKVQPNPYILHHYHNGELNKQYDRQLTAKSIYRFMSDPTGDIPWDEDPTSVNIVHIENKKEFVKVLARKKPTLIMFYAPWCGHCKRVKPEFSDAANELKGKVILAAIDATQNSNQPMVEAFKIEGYPTMHYFENGEHKFRFTGLSTKEGIMAWLKNPTDKEFMPPKPAEDEKPWSEIESDVVHLDDEKFDAFMASHPSVLVMFYAPWCGHCKKAKPEYMAAAEQLKSENVEGVLAAIDATVHRKAAEKIGVEGFPTFAYYKNGKYSWKINERTKDGFYKFMKNPVEPPPADQPWSAEENNLLHLNANNFRFELKKKKDALVMFYAPWCQYCKRAKPFYMEAAQQLADESRIALAAVDCSTEVTLCSDYGVKGFPTIIYLSYGKHRVDYNGAHTTESFIEFVKEAGLKAGQTTYEVDSTFGHHIQGATDGNFKELIATQTTLVMFYSPLCKTCDDAKAAFRGASEMAKNRRFVLVDCTYARGVCDELKIKDYPTFKLFVDGKMENYMGKHTSDQLVDVFNVVEQQQQQQRSEL